MPYWFDFAFFGDMVTHMASTAAIEAKNMQQFRQPQDKIIGVEPSAENSNVDILERAGIAANKVTYCF